uniref:Uncharacterized protein n=1 Tax=Strombidium rassoulzadegani TaxID=1082188 RepID=A0A7S3FUF3_9SPIT|mmetsp:Transcript_15908/g.26810  ORF Transcript_15908/g.26810 Transcript_15908/m.26810 type:complete len:342 (+) Transcript_15908:266-1291(+)
MYKIYGTDQIALVNPKENPYVLQVKDREMAYKKQFDQISAMQRKQGVSQFGENQQSIQSFESPSVAQKKFEFQTELQQQQSHAPSTFLNPKDGLTHSMVSQKPQFVLKSLHQALQEKTPIKKELEEFDKVLNLHRKQSKQRLENSNKKQSPHSIREGQSEAFTVQSRAPLTSKMYNMMGKDENHLKNVDEQGVPNLITFNKDEMMLDKLETGSNAHRYLQGSQIQNQSVSKPFGINVTKNGGEAASTDMGLSREYPNHRNMMTNEEAPQVLDETVNHESIPNDFKESGITTTSAQPILPQFPAKSTKPSSIKVSQKAAHPAGIGMIPSASKDILKSGSDAR